MVFLATGDKVTSTQVTVLGNLMDGCSGTRAATWDEERIFSFSLVPLRV